MAEDRRSQRPARGGKPGRPSSGRPERSGSGKPAAKGGRPGSGKQGAAPSGGGRSSDRKSWGGKPGSDRAGGGNRDDRRSERPGQRGERADRGQRTGGSRAGAPDRDRSAVKRAPEGPPIPEGITGRELDRSVAAQLKGLPEMTAAKIARHLAAAGVLIDEDPEAAYQHAMAARARAPRLAVVREAAGEAAYAAGHYSEALAELRAAKRMNGATAYLPIMADCHRALGNPDQALKLAKSPSVVGFPPPAKAEMTIVEAGARRDMGQMDAALRTLEQAPLQTRSRAPWVVRLRYAYADTLEAAGRLTDALAWFHRTHAIDGEELTDAAERAATLEKRLDQGSE